MRKGFGLSDLYLELYFFSMALVEELKELTEDKTLVEKNKVERIDAIMTDLNLLLSYFRIIGVDTVALTNLETNICRIEVEARRLRSHKKGDREKIVERALEDIHANMDIIGQYVDNKERSITTGIKMIEKRHMDFLLRREPI